MVEVRCGGDRLGQDSLVKVRSGWFGSGQVGLAWVGSGRVLDCVGCSSRVGSLLFHLIIMWVGLHWIVFANAQVGFG